MFRGHPKGLVPLFITEAFERFCFYGVRSIIILYMWTTVANGGLGWEKAEAINFFGTYLFMAYIMTIPGGWVADRYWGQRRALYVGGTLMAAGYFTLAVGGLVSLYAGLALICVGNGFFKPCVTTIFGSLYKSGDPARDSGYSLFYMGINLGAMIAPFACGSFTGPARFSLGFLVAGCAMIAAMGVFLKGRKTLGEIGLKPKKKEVTSQGGGVLTTDEKKRLGVVVMLSVLIMCFFAAFEQGAGLIALYAQDYTRRAIGGFLVPVPWFQSLNSFFVILLGPFMAVMWKFFIKRRIHWTVCYKFALGFFLTAIAFIVMVFAAKEFDRVQSSSILWLVCFNFFVTAGELCLTPILWSNVSQITPKRFLSMMMAVTLTGVGFGYRIGGLIGGLIGTHSALEIFWGIAVVSALFGLISIGANGFVERMTHGKVSPGRRKRAAAAEL